VIPVLAVARITKVAALFEADGVAMPVVPTAGMLGEVAADMPRQ
jgi:hypothetical protein